MAILKRQFSSLSDLTITLESLASAAGRVSAQFTNSDFYPGAIVYVRLKSSASAPAVGGSYRVYLVRQATGYNSDGAGTADAAATIENATLLGVINITNTANKFFYGDFDTRFVGDLGVAYSIAIVNGTDQSLNSTTLQHFVKVQHYRWQSE